MSTSQLIREIKKKLKSNVRLNNMPLREGGVCNPGNRSMLGKLE